MIKQLTCLMLSLGFICSSYADPATTAPTATTTTSQNTANDASASADTANAPQVSYDETAPMIFQVGKQKFLVNKEDVALITPTLTACYNGIWFQLTQDKGNQLQSFTTQNLNQPMQIHWNNITLGDEVLDAPLGNQLCLSYVQPDVQQALMNEFSSNQNGSNPATSQSVKN